MTDWKGAGIGAILVAALLGTFGTPEAAAQSGRFRAGEATIVDRVAAVVGDSVILQTQIEERILQLQASGMELPDDPAGFADLQDEVLTTLVNEQLLLQAAVKDTLITLDEDRLESDVQEEWESRAEQFPGGQAAMMEALERDGFTPAAYREFLRSQLRKQQLQAQLIQRRQATDRVTISEEEVEAFFRENSATLPERPATMTLEQLILQAVPSPEAQDSALALADRVLQMYRSEEEEFEDLARRFSDDPGSARNGGDLGWFRRGGFVEEFDNAAFAMLEGQVSAPVKTVYGYHIILLERARGPERKARHILIAFDITPEDVQASRTLGAEIRDRVEGGESLRAISRELEDELAFYDSVTVATDQLSSFPPALGNALRLAAEGTVVGPVEAGGRPGNPNLAVVQVQEVREAGTATLDDLRPQIEAAIRREKVLDSLLDELRRNTYVSIKI